MTTTTTTATTTMLNKAMRLAVILLAWTTSSFTTTTTTNNVFVVGVDATAAAAAATTITASTINPRRMWNRYRILQENPPDAYQPYAVGTDVWYEFGDGWYEGSISSYSAVSTPPFYQILWEDGDVDQYTNLTLVEEMVNNAAYYEQYENGGDLSGYQPWEIGSLVMQYFDVDDAATAVKEEGAGWYGGTITDFQMTTTMATDPQQPNTNTTTTIAEYTVTWSDGQMAVYDDLRLVDGMVRSYERYEPWLEGTPVATSENGVVWMTGTIATYDNVGPPVYTIEWMGGDGNTMTRTYHNLDLVDEQVENFRTTNTAGQDVGGDETVVDFVDGADAINKEYVPWDKDTPVYYVFDGDGFEGKIVHFHPEEESYEIVWSDGESTLYGRDQWDLVDEMVQNAIDEEKNDEIANIPAEYEVGTKIYKEYDAGEWWVGEIVAYDSGWYTVRYTDDTFVDYAVNDETVKDMVENAKNIPSDEESQQYQIGTAVYREFSDGWYTGVIRNYVDLMYTVVWEDGEIDYYVKSEELDMIVAQAQMIPTLQQQTEESKGGMSSAGLIFLFLFVLGGLTIGVVLFQKRIKNIISRQTMAAMDDQTRKMMGLQASPQRTDEELSFEKANEFDTVEQENLPEVL